MYAFYNISIFLLPALAENSQYQEVWFCATIYVLNDVFFSVLLSTMRRAAISNNLINSPCNFFSKKTYVLFEHVLNLKKLNERLTDDASLHLVIRYCYLVSLLIIISLIVRGHLFRGITTTLTIVELCYTNNKIEGERQHHFNDYLHILI